jgi:hypothetical protein
MQADVYGGYNRLCAFDRKLGPIVEALCCSHHSQREFFELAHNARRGRDAAPTSPLALQAVKRIDVIFDIERALNGLAAETGLPRGA